MEGEGTPMKRTDDCVGCTRRETCPDALTAKEAERGERIIDCAGRMTDKNSPQVRIVTERKLGPTCRIEVRRIQRGSRVSWQGIIWIQAAKTWSPVTVKPFARKRDALAWAMDVWSGRKATETFVEICRRYEAANEAISSPGGLRDFRIDRMIDLEKIDEALDMDWAGLLAAGDDDFMHDVAGIHRHMNRETGILENCFLPRFAR